MMNILKKIPCKHMNEYVDFSTTLYIDKIVFYTLFLNTNEPSSGYVKIVLVY